MIELTDVLEQIFTFIHLTILDLGASQLVLVVKNQPANAGDIRDVGSISGIRKIPWKRAWQPA